MAHAREVFVLMRRHTPQTLVSHLDFCTSPTPRPAPGGGGQATGRGVTRLITPLGILCRDDDELSLHAVAPGVHPSEVIAATGWPLTTSGDVAVQPAPGADEMRLLRTELDPDRIYLR
jgi:glutaconate CoA-transferase subunit B